MRSIFIIPSFLLCLAAFLAACQSPDSGEKASAKETLLIATAANVQFVMKELKAAFESETGIAVDVVISSSGKLTAQIQQGAPYDLLLSANMKYPRTLYEEGLAEAEPHVYALGALVLWTLKDHELPEDPRLLLDPQFEKVAIANPKNAPYGQQAIRLFEYFGMLEDIRPRLIYGESIAQTNQYIISRACDAGLTAKSVVLSSEMKDQGHWGEMPAGAYQSIEQGVIITRHGQQTHPDAARRFYDFLFSEKAKEIFREYGYLIPGRAAN